MLTASNKQAQKVANVQAKATAKANDMYNNKGGIGLEFGKAGGRDKTYASWWTDALAAQKSALAAKKKESIEAAKVLNAKPKVDPMIKREQRIENLQNRLAYTMRKGGVSMGASDAFFKGSFKSHADQFRNTGDISNFSQQVGLASRKMIDASKSAKTMGRSVHDMRSMVVAATQAYTAFAALQNVANTGMKLESMEAGMKLFAGSDKGVAAEMEYIKGVSDRLGLSLMDAAEQYNKFNIVSRNKMTPEERKELFVGLSEYATVLQVTPERFQRSMMAINQMMSKGKLSSEELRLNCSLLA